jgi:hypothetical protein
MLAGRDVIACDEKPDLCPPQPELGDTEGKEIHVRATDAGTFLIFTPVKDEEDLDGA